MPKNKSIPFVFQDLPLVGCVLLGIFLLISWSQAVWEMFR